MINGPLSSTVTKQAKLKAWEEVVAAIRRECPLDPEGNGSQKELKDVRKKWQNLLAEAKRAISRNKEYLSGSGKTNIEIIYHFILAIKPP